MSHTTRNRGAHPNDLKDFSEKHFSALRTATEQLSLLLSIGYPENASLKLVGDHFRLTQRQRMAIKRASCSDFDFEKRTTKQIKPKNLKGAEILIDGFNLLITLETAYSGGYVFEGVDGCFRDQASIHGSYKQVAMTQKAIETVGHFLEKYESGKVYWYFDTPVSNSGRLKVLLYEISTKNNWNWQIELDYNPDNILKASNEIIVSSDAIILNECECWLNLGREIIENEIPKAKLIKLSN